MIINKVKAILVIGLLTLPVVFANSFASSFENTFAKNLTNTVYTQNEYTKLSKAGQNSIASMWNITSQDYSHYLWLMHHSPSSKWYKQLNPAEVLGINAASDQERMHYAMLVVKNAHDRIARELAFQKAYDKAWGILYPKLKPISEEDKEEEKNDE